MCMCHVSLHFREEKEKFIRTKYVDKEFLADLPDTKQPLSQVITAFHYTMVILLRYSVIVCMQGMQ